MHAPLTELTQSIPTRKSDSNTVSCHVSFRHRSDSYAIVVIQAALMDPSPVGATALETSCLSLE